MVFDVSHSYYETFVQFGDKSTVGIAQFLYSPIWIQIAIILEDGHNFCDNMSPMSYVIKSTIHFFSQLQSNILTLNMGTWLQSSYFILKKSHVNFKFPLDTWK